MISVILPTYNAAKTLRRTIDALLNQTFKDFELIIVDDGSTDNTPGLIQEYHDSRIVVLRKENGGVSSARNAALSIARGTYIAFADADDDIRENWLTAFVETIGNADIALQGIIFKTDQGETTHYIPANEDGDSNSRLAELLIRRHILGYLFGKLFRRDIIERHGLRFNQNLKFREDDVFVLAYINHIRTWASTEDANYIYYVPATNKDYGQSATQCTEEIFRLVKQIFNGNVPQQVSDELSWSIKGAVIERLLAGQKLSKEIIQLYREYVAPQNKDIPSKIIAAIVLNSRRIGTLSNTLIKLIHKLSS